MISIGYCIHLISFLLLLLLFAFSKMMPNMHRALKCYLILLSSNSVQ